MTCTIYIDESGDTGVRVLRGPNKRGSSEYFTMGAVAVQPATGIAARKLLLRLQDDFKKTRPWKHATDLNHTQKLHFCRELSKLHIRYFGLISRKPTLGEYADRIDHDPHKFYNKCAKYLLEMIGGYLTSVSGKLTEPRIVFEDRNHDFDAMRRYLGKVKENPLHPKSRQLASINPFAIINESKSNEDLLRLADLVSHAIYSCVNKTPDNFEIVEPRYLEELSGRFAASTSGSVLGIGLKCIHSVEDLELDPVIQDRLVGLKATPRAL